MTGTTTTNTSMYKPLAGEVGWAAAVNANFDKLDGSTAAVYVATTGNDSNSGTSWGDAKLTIKGGMDALPTVGGKVYYESGVWAQPDHTKGLWLTTAGTSGYITSKPFILEGRKFGANVGLAAGGPAALISTPSGDVGIKYDSAANNTHEHLYRFVSMNDCSVAIRSGVTDGGTRNPGAGSIGGQNKAFEYCQFRCDQASSMGPTVDLGAFNFWWWFRNCVLIANETYARSDKRSCNVYADPGNASTAGLVYFYDCIFGGGGGIRINPGPTGGINMVVRHTSSEGTTTGAEPGTAQPIFEILESTNSTPAYTGMAVISDIEQADSLVNPTVRVYSGVNPWVVNVNNVAFVSGPATLLGGRAQATDSAGTLNTAREQNQVGIVQGNFHGQHDSTQRRMGLTAARYVNLATQDTAAWGATTGSATVTTGQNDIMGGTNAAKLVSGGGTLNKQIYRATPGTLAVGDWYIGGAWARMDSGSPGTDFRYAAISIAGGSGTWATGTTRTNKDQPPRQHWFWSWAAAKFTAGSGAKPEVIFALQASDTGAMHYCFPVFFRIPASDGWSDAEVYEMVAGLQPHSHTAPAGTLANQFQVPIHVGPTFLELGVMTGPSAPASDYARLYVDTSGGKDRLAVRFNSGAVQVIATEP